MIAYVFDRRSCKIARGFNEARLVDDFSILSHEKLEGFVDEAIAILSKNPNLTGRIDLYENLLTEKVNRLLSIANFD